MARTLQIHSNVVAMSLKLNDIAKIIEKPVEPADEQEHKHILNEMFEEQGVGKPRGTLQEKQQQHFDLAMTGKIKNQSKKNTGSNC